MKYCPWGFYCTRGGCRSKKPRKEDKYSSFNGEWLPEECKPEDVRDTTKKCQVMTEATTAKRCGPNYNNAYCNEDRWCKTSGWCSNKKPNWSRNSDWHGSERPKECEVRTECGWWATSKGRCP